MVYISSAEPDRAIAVEFQSYCLKQGLACELGDPNKLEAAQTAVLIWTSSTGDDVQCKREIQRACNCNISILTMELGTSKPPANLAAWASSGDNGLNAFGPGILIVMVLQLIILIMSLLGWKPSNKQIPSEIPAFSINEASLLCKLLVDFQNKHRVGASQVTVRKTDIGQDRTTHNDNFDTAFTDEAEPEPRKRVGSIRLDKWRELFGPSDDVNYEQDPRGMSNDKPEPGLEAGPGEVMTEGQSFLLKSATPSGRGVYMADVPRPAPVDCSVFAPKDATLPQNITFVQAWLHQPAQAEETELQALEFDKTAAKRGWTSLGTRLTPGDKVTLSLAFEGAFTTASVSQELIWEGRPCYASFIVTTGSTPGLAVGTLTVSQNSVPIGRISFGLKVAGDAPRDMQISLAPAGEAQRFKQAFVSYASVDRTEVLKRVQMLKAVGLGCFQDVLDLAPGELWEKSLYHHIDEADVFFLFWSSAASQSEWVGREWHYALDHKGLDFILPVIIEGPPIAAPPEELSALHFNDGLLYFMQ